ncbi:MAG: hypothetical protein RR404_01055 [Bacilli bacterium]
MFDLETYLKRRATDGVTDHTIFENMSYIAGEFAKTIEGLGYHASPDDIQAAKGQPTIKFNKDNGMSAELTIKPGERFAFYEKCNEQMFSSTIYDKNRKSREDHLMDINGSMIGSVVTDKNQIGFYNKESLNYAKVTDCIKPDEVVNSNRYLRLSFSEKMLEGAEFAEKKRAELGLTNGKTK